MKFTRLAEFFERIEAASKRLDMVGILSELFQEANDHDARIAVYLSQGSLEPPFMGAEIGMSVKLLIRSISEAAQVPTARVEETYRATGDLGLTAEQLVRGSGGLDIADVYRELRDIADTSGKGSVEQKINYMSNLLRGVTPLECRYVSRFVIGRLRLGVGDPTVLEAIANVEVSRALGCGLLPVLEQSMGRDEKLAAFGAMNINDGLMEEVRASLGGRADEVKVADAYLRRVSEMRKQARQALERAYNICSDLGRVVSVYKAEGMRGVEALGITVGYPVRMALCERLPGSREIIEKMGRVAVEAKYDGLRAQVHREGQEVNIFSRNLERMTGMFPEIVEAARAIEADTFIIEGEALAYNEATGELLPFQVTMQRKRKHDIDAMSKEFPLRFFAFELLYLNGTDYTGRAYTERRARMEALVEGNPTIVKAEMFLTGDPAEIDRHFAEFLEVGLEGVVAKRLDSPYAAGARNFNWIKLKRSYRGELADSVDIVIVGYFLGRGARARFGLGALLCAVYDKDADTFKTITKVGTGFSEEDLARLKSMLDPIALRQRHPRVMSMMEADVWVTPRYVITVTADEITRSPMHTAGMKDGEPGYALRFPRAVGLYREDKNAEDANTVAEIITMYQQQATLRNK